MKIEKILEVRKNYLKLLDYEGLEREFRYNSSTYKWYNHVTAINVSDEFNTILTLTYLMHRETNEN